MRGKTLCWGKTRMGQHSHGATLAWGNTRMGQDSHGASLVQKRKPGTAQLRSSPPKRSFLSPAVLLNYESMKGTKPELPPPSPHYHHILSTSTTSHLQPPHPIATATPHSLPPLPHPIHYHHHTIYNTTTTTTTTLFTTTNTTLFITITTTTTTTTTTLFTTTTPYFLPPHPIYYPYMQALPAAARPPINSSIATDF
ncbi:hypothetical protein FHG87_011852 [Trinorchestia longiramus]|nr:hypothetical protein FHG87_011852 [Trinorchestia longiramus]